MRTSRPSALFFVVAGFLAATTIGLLAHIIISVGPDFRNLVHFQILDFRLTGYEPEAVGALMVALRQSPDAADILRNLHLFEDMLVPACFTTLALMVLSRYAPGARVFHAPLTGARVGIVLVMPILYVLCDLTENIASLMIFPPADPSPEMVTYLAQVLPAATRLKGLFFFVSLILMLRFTLFREKDPESPSLQHEPTEAHGDPR